MLSFALRKGGVCRTTLVFNLSYAIAMQGYRVLMIDLDSQHNLTNICVDLPEDASTIYDALADGQEIGSAIFPTSHERLFLLPGDSEMSTLDFALAEVSPDQRFQILKRWIEISPITKEFDLITIDMGPAMNGAMINALVASSHFIAPFRCNADSFDGLSQLFDEMADEVYQDNPDVKFIGAVLVDYDKRKNICKGVANELKKRLGKELINPWVRTNANFETARPLRRSIFEFESAEVRNKDRRKGRDDVMAVSEEIVKRLGLKQKGKVVKLPTSKKVMPRRAANE